MKKLTTLALLSMFAVSTIHGKEKAEKSEVPCRSLTEANYLVGQDEEIVDGKVCKKVSKPTALHSQATTQQETPAAQPEPRPLGRRNASIAEVFAGYSYLNFDTQGLAGRLSLNGWEASAAFNLNRWIGAEADFSGHYKGDCGGAAGLTCKDLSFMAGPRLTYRQNRITAFAHGLFGGDNGTLAYSGVSVSDTPFCLAAGGGVDVAVANHISLRVLQADYLMTRHLNTAGVPHQNNIRASAGIVFTFGGTGTSRSASGSPRQLVPGQASNTSEAALLGVAGYPTEDGYKVTSIRPGSPAERISLKPGDVITEIDGKSIHSAREIESAIAANPSGTVTVTGYTHRVGAGQVLLMREVNVR